MTHIEPVPPAGDAIGELHHLTDGEELGPGGAIADRGEGIVGVHQHVDGAVDDHTSEEEVDLAVKPHVAEDHDTEVMPHVQHDQLLAVQNQDEGVHQFVVLARVEDPAPAPQGATQQLAVHVTQTLLKAPGSVEYHSTAIHCCHRHRKRKNAQDGVVQEHEATHGTLADQFFLAHQRRPDQHHDQVGGQRGNHGLPAHENLLVFVDLLTHQVELINEALNLFHVEKKEKKMR
mmetsp:Transcript_43962/g.110815  ORF Transcript_43962/g.110815 Transcript_43962/m.110815 type:complete len:232 (+) Transcript_43962:276-971(+)